MADNKTHVKILWMYWEQDIKNILDYRREWESGQVEDGKYIKMCFDGWKKLNPDWDIRILNEKTALKYVPELANYNHLIRAHRADVLRLKLLEKYGGVWADASALPMRPLSGWIEDCDNGTGIFFFRYFPEPETNGSNIANWFIVAKKPNHYLIKKLSRTFSNRVKDKTKTISYFYFHRVMNNLIEKDKRIKDCIFKLTQPAMPLRAYYFEEYDSNHLKYDNDKGVNKPLCYKRYLKVNHEDYYFYINNFFKTITIGSSKTNTKIIKLDKIYPKNTKLTFMHKYKDTFTYNFGDNKLSITRTDETKGWGQKLIGYL